MSVRLVWVVEWWADGEWHYSIFPTRKQAEERWHREAERSGNECVGYRSYPELPQWIDLLETRDDHLIYHRNP